MTTRSGKITVRPRHARHRALVGAVGRAPQRPEADRDVAAGADVALEHLEVALGLGDVLEGVLGDRDVEVLAELRALRGDEAELEHVGKLRLALQALLRERDERSSMSIPSTRRAPWRPNSKHEDP